MDCKLEESFRNLILIVQQNIDEFMVNSEICSFLLSSTPTEPNYKMDTNNKFLRITKEEAEEIIEKVVGEFFTRLESEMKNKKKIIKRINTVKRQTFNVSRAVYFLPKSLRSNLKCRNMLKRKASPRRKEKESNTPSKVQKKANTPSRVQKEADPQLESSMTSINNSVSKEIEDSLHPRDNEIDLLSLPSTCSTLQCGQVFPSSPPKNIFHTSKKDRNINLIQSSGESDVYKFRDSSAEKGSKYGKKKREIEPVPGHFKKYDIRNYFNKIEYETQSSSSSQSEQEPTKEQPTLMEILDLIDFDDLSQIPGNQEALRLYVSS